MTPADFSAFVKSDSYKSLRKIDFSTFCNLNSTYHQKYPDLFYNSDYSIYERQSSGFTGILNLLNKSQADELFHTIINLSYELCNNLKHSILYRKEYPTGHNVYLSSLYSYKIKKTDFKFLRTSPSGNGPTVSTDDRISTLTNDPILVNSESELGGTNSNILEFDKSFTDLLSERPLEENLERIPDISYKLARNGNLPMKNNRLYLKMLELNLGKSSIIFDSEPSRLSNLQWYHGEILLRLIFDTTVSEDVIHSVLARPNFMGLVRDNTDFIPLDFLKRLASSEPLTKACRLDDVIIKFVLNQFQACISTDYYLGDSFVLSQMIRNKGRSSFKIW